MLENERVLLPMVITVYVTETADFLGGLRPVRGKDQLLAAARQLLAHLCASAGAQPRADAATSNSVSVVLGEFEHVWSNSLDENARKSFAV